MATSRQPTKPVVVRESITIAAGAFKDVCLQLMDEVNATSREYVITKHGRPVARLVPPDPLAQSGFGFLAGTVTENEDIVSPDFNAWEYSDALSR